MNNNLSPYVRLAMHHTYLKGYYIERHIWDHEIIFIERGKMKLTINNKVIHVEKNDCIFMTPNVYHKLEWNGEDCQQPHVHFDFFYEKDSPDVKVSMIRKDQMSDKELSLFRKSYLKEKNINLPYVFKLRGLSIVRSILYQIIDEYTFKMNCSDILLQGLMTQLIGAVIRDYHLGQIEKASDELNLNVFLSSTEDRTVDNGGCIVIDKKYYYFVEDNGNVRANLKPRSRGKIHKCLDGQMVFEFDNVYYQLIELEERYETSKDFDNRQQ